MTTENKTPPPQTGPYSSKLTRTTTIKLAPIELTTTNVEELVASHPPAPCGCGGGGGGLNLEAIFPIIQAVMQKFAGAAADSDVEPDSEPHAH